MKDLAFVTQKLLEGTVLAIVEIPLEPLKKENLVLGGSVVVNYKRNKRLRKSDTVDDTVTGPTSWETGG